MDRATTLDVALKEYRGVGPGFHMLRHLLSALILIHHCRVAVFGIHADDTYAKGAALTASALSGLRWDHLFVELLRPGLFALVAMFFGLSGFLVVGSALRTKSIKVFFANRALRIIPALSVEVTLSALVLGPYVTSFPLAEYFRDPKFFAYFGNILGHVTLELPGVFLRNPWPTVVNANLWTLPAEFWCYALMLTLMATRYLARTRWLTIVVFCSVLIWTVLATISPATFSIRDDTTHFSSYYIVMMFCFGVIFFINADRIVLHPVLFVLAAAGYYVLTLLDQLGPLSGILLTYCMVFIGMMRFPTFDRLLKVDLSYGIYLYGFPITQALIYALQPSLAGLPAMLRFAIIMPLVIILTALFSTVSWTYIEKPALQLRKRFLP